MPPESLYSRLTAALSNSWRLKARPEQLPPTGSWQVWLVQAGRGWGKTRTGAEWVQEQAMTGACRRLGLIAPTAADVREVLVEGPSGLLNIAPGHARPIYEPSKRRLTWPNGAIASLYSADEPDRLRGPEHDGLWADEIAAWRYPETWDLAVMGLRRGSARAICTTTPKPVRIVRELLAREGQDVVVTRGRTRDNAANLSPAALAAMEARFGGTRLGRQELDGELLDDVPGALWQRGWIDRDRTTTHPDLKRVVVAVDPAVSNHEGSDETGIVVVGLGVDGHLYVLADETDRYGPLDWARRAISAYREHEADRIVAEVNNGGLMVETTLRSVDPAIPFKAVHASRGKVVRAEPVSALYEQRKVHHVGTFADLEDQMCAFTSDFNRSTAGYSPDNLDALVWACTELQDGMQVIDTSQLVGRYSYGGGPIIDSPYTQGSRRGHIPEWAARGELYPPGDFRWQLEDGQKWLAARARTE